MSESNPSNCGRGLTAFAEEIVAQFQESGLSRREARKLYHRKMRELARAAERKRYPVVPPGQIKK